MKIGKIYYTPEDISIIFKKIKKEIDALPTTITEHELYQTKDAIITYNTIGVEKENVLKIIDKYNEKWGARNDEETEERTE